MDKVRKIIVRGLALVAAVGLSVGIGRGQEAPWRGAHPGAVAAQGPTAWAPALAATAAPAQPGVSPVGQAPPAGAAGPAEAGPRTTLAELEELALRCNPSLARAQARVTAARGDQVQAGLYPNPTAGYLGSEMGNSGRAGQQGAFWGQEVVTAGKLRWAENAAGQAVHQAHCAAAAQRLRVLTDVRRGFYDVLVAQGAVDLSLRLVELADRGVTTAEELFKAQEVARADILQARIEAQSARILSDKARNRHAAAWRTLAAVVGDPGMAPRPLAGGLRDGVPQFTWEGLVERLWSESPEVAAASAAVARAQAALERELAGRYPNLDLQTAIQHDYSTGYTYGNLQVGVPVPLFNRNQGNIQKAQAELAAAQQDLRRLQLALQQRLAGVFEKYETAGQQVQKYERDILPAAEESLKLVSAGYRQGELGYLALLTAQRTWVQTHLTYLDALHELRSAAAALEGNLLWDSLEAGESGDGGK